MGRKPFRRETIADQGFFEPNPIRQAWVEHLSGRWHWQYELRDVLMFQQWLEHARQAL
jgi:asparagine synthase (glutamine-hydrolysing)